MPSGSMHVPKITYRYNSIPDYVLDDMLKSLTVMGIPFNYMVHEVSPRLIPGKLDAKVTISKDYESTMDELSESEGSNYEKL